MKIGNRQALVKNYKTVSFFRGDEQIEFRVAPLPFGWQDKIDGTRVLEHPIPPKTVMRDAKGMVVKDEKNQGVVVEDRDNPEYKQKVQQLFNRRLMLQIAEMLRDDDSVVFDTPAPKDDSTAEWVRYADGLYAEVQDSGLTDNEISEIIQAGMDASLKIDIDEAKVDFLS